MSTSSDKKLRVCTNFRANPNHPSCGARGSDAILTVLTSKKLAICIEESPCMGLCDVGPNIRLTPNGNCFNEVTIEKLDTVIKEIKSIIAC
jgi:(2Fe-2S) ferredoxin